MKEDIQINYWSFHFKVEQGYIKTNINELKNTYVKLKVYLVIKVTNFITFDNYLEELEGTIFLFRN